MSQISKLPAGLEAALAQLRTIMANREDDRTYLKKRVEELESELEVIRVEEKAATTFALEETDNLLMVINDILHADHPLEEEKAFFPQALPEKIAELKAKAMICDAIIKSRKREVTTEIAFGSFWTVYAAIRILEDASSMEKVVEVLSAMRKQTP